MNGIESETSEILCQYTQLHNISVADLVIKYLELEGVTHVFGIPGGYISPFLDILRRHPSIKLIIARHEEGAAFMADGYARRTGKLGVIFTTAGPGATNALTGIACAKADQVPLMLIVGHPSTRVFGYGAWQDSSSSEINICEVFRHICGFSEMAVDPENFPSFFSRALKVAYGSLRQPVQLSLPINISSSSISKVHFPLSRNYIFREGHFKNQVGESQVKSIFKLLLTSQNPMILLGSGCTEAFRKPVVLALFSDFVKRHHIPVMTTPKGKGLFPETEALSLGVFGLGGSQQSSLYLEHHPPDTLIILGSSLNEWASKQWDPKLMPSKTLVQVDIDPSHIGRVYPVHCGLILDIELFIVYLMEADKQCPLTSNESLKREIKLETFKKKISPYIQLEKMHSQHIPLKPQTLFCELSHFAEHKKIAFFLDIGNSTGFFSHYMQLGQDNLLYSAYGFTCMGWSTGASIGAKLASPDLNCIAILGDGAFLMNGVEIQTAARYKIGVIYMVIFDNRYGMVHHGEKFASPFPCPDDDFYSLGSPDLVKFAESLGAEAYSVDKPGQLREILSQACQNATLNQRPQVIVATIDPNEVAPFTGRYQSISREKQLMREKPKHECTTES